MLQNLTAPGSGSGGGERAGTPADATPDPTHGPHPDPTPDTTPDTTGDTPRWLDADERLTWLVLVSLLQTLPGALDAQLQRDSELSFFEYMVLAMLSEQEDRTLRMSRLAAVTNGSMSRLSHVAAKLERRGLLRREPCPGDGRAINAVLTDSGWETVVASAPWHVNRVRELVLDPLTRTQQAQLRAIGGRILDAVSPAGERLPVGGRR